MFADWILGLANAALHKLLLEWFPELPLDIILKAIEVYGPKLAKIYEEWFGEPRQFDFELGQLRAEIKQWVADFEAGLEGGTQ